MSSPELSSVQLERIKKKVVVVGDENSGKSALIRMLCDEASLGQAKPDMIINNPEDRLETINPYI